MSSILSAAQAIRELTPDARFGEVVAVRGALIEVDLPIDDPAPEPEQPPPQDALTEKVLVAVPPGLGPGDLFSVETAWGGVFEIRGRLSV